MSPDRSCLVAVAALALVLTASTEASGQVLPIREIHISNSTEDWSVGMRPFDVTRHVSIFVVFTSGRHTGFQWSGQCVVALAATHQPLHAVRIHPEYMRPGNDVLRSESFRMAWPTSPVEVTCVPDGNPAGAFTAIIGIEWQRRPITGALQPTAPGLLPALPAERRAQPAPIPTALS